MSSQIRFSAVLLIGSAFALGGLGAASWAASEPQGDAAAAVDVRAIAQTPDSPEEYTIIHINAQSGSDLQGDGSQLRPYQTIAHALSLATDSTLILLAGGIYSAESGETFPLVMKPQVTVQGMSGPNTRNVIIQGGGSFYSNSSGMRQVAILGADNAGLADVTVSNPHPEGVGLWIESGNPVIINNAFVDNGLSGIYIAGNGAPVIRGNYFSENGQAGLVIAGASSAEVESNIFDNTGAGITVAPEATPQILNNRISRNLDGLIVHAEAHPILSGNQITRNRRNSIVDYAAWSDMPAIRPSEAAQPPPPSQPIATNTAAVSPAPAPEPIEASPIPAAIAPPPGAPSESSVTPAIAAVPASPATLPESAPTIAAQADLGENLSADLTDTATALARLALPETPAIAAQSALTQLEFAPLLAASADLSQSYEDAAAEKPATETFSPPEPDTLTLENLEPLPLNQAAPSVPQPETPDNPSAPDAISITVTPAPNAPLPEVGEQPAAVATPTANTTLPSEPVTQELPELSPPASETLVPERSGSGSQPLQVPGGDIPMGSGSGELPELFITGAGSALPSTGPPPPPSLAASLGLSYRVLVPAADAATQAQIREQVSDAFRVRRSDRTYMQVGAYPTLEEAEAQVERLNQLGIQAQIEEIP